jgi:uncharacterized protein YcsI (UPF0317 family)
MTATTKTSTHLTPLDRTDPWQVRRDIRSGNFREFTNSVARGYVQGNLVCRRNLLL